MAITTTFLEQGKQRPGDIAALLADFLSGANTGLHVLRLTGQAAKIVGLSGDDD